MHTVRPAVPVVVPPSSAGKRAIKKQFCRSRTARFAIRGKSALAELGCIAGTASPCTRCLSNISKARPARPLRGNRRTCAVVHSSSAGKRATKKQFCRSRTARFAIRGKSALAELGCTTCSLQTVLHETEARFCLILRGFSGFLLFVHQFLNPRFCRFLSDFNPNLFLMCRLLC